MMNLIFGTHLEKSRLALRGKVNFRPLLFIMWSLLLLSYLSSFYFADIYGTFFSKKVIDLGMAYVPAVGVACGISNNSEACRFTMSAQWLASILYILTLFTVYCPFRRMMRVAAHKASIIKPISYTRLRGFGFVLFGIAYVLGDLGVTKFPTFFNGVFFSGSPPQAVFFYIINSALYMPLFSWLSAFGTIMIYWMWLYIIANLNTIFEISDEEGQMSNG
jgi:hypothetical protein